MTKKFGWFFYPGLTIGLLFFGGKSLFAYKPTVLSPEIQSIRQMGMGSAYTAIANDETLLMANPAGIGIRKMFQNEDSSSIFYFLPIKLGISHDLYSALSSRGFGKFIYDDFLNSSSSLQMPSDFVYANDFWAISLFTQIYFGGFLNQDSDYHYEFSLLSQIKVGFNVYSFSFLSDEDFHIGVSGKVFYLLQIERGLSLQQMYNKFADLQKNFETISIQRLSDILSEILNVYEGFGLGIDLGIIWELPIKNTEHQINVGIMLEDFPTYGFSVPVFSGIYKRQAYVGLCEDYLSVYTELSPTGEDDLAIYGFCENLESTGVSYEATLLTPNAKLGVVYKLPNYLGSYFRDTLFALDFHRIGTPGYSFADVYHIGVSTSIFDFTDEETGRGYRMNLSMGVSQSQFNLGLIFHLKIYELAYNYYRKSILNFDKAHQRHIITIAFYF